MSDLSVRLVWFRSAIEVSYILRHSFIVAMFSARGKSLHSVGMEDGLYG